jgi:uncharacterized membrane protein
MSQEPKDNLPVPQENLSIPANKQPESPGKEPPRVTRQIATYESFRGPLPNPAILQAYEKIIPGCAERIIKMAENQADHRIHIENTVIEGDTKRANRGLYCGAFISFIALLLSGFLIYTGHDWAGVTIASTVIVGLASVFIYGTISRRTERTEKAKTMKTSDLPESPKDVTLKPPNESV